mmetsp:Transcript_62268/g.196606  ORF Transcript_62268/g.196606 Transcript_62268/m.196606 type:complete len:339 (-) Transcript_62268:193-1209(-)
MVEVAVHLQRVACRQADSVRRGEEEQGPRGHRVEAIQPGCAGARLEAQPQEEARDVRIGVSRKAQLARLIRLHRASIRKLVKLQVLTRQGLRRQQVPGQGLRSPTRQVLLARADAAAGPRHLGRQHQLQRRGRCGCQHGLSPMGQEGARRSEEGPYVQEERHDPLSRGHESQQLVDQHLHRALRHAPTGCQLRGGERQNAHATDGEGAFPLKTRHHRRSGLGVRPLAFNSVDNIGSGPRRGHGEESVGAGAQVHDHAPAARVGLDLVQEGAHAVPVTLHVGVLADCTKGGDAPVHVKVGRGVWNADFEQPSPRVLRERHRRRGVLPRNGRAPFLGPAP